jgi:hypothetical protein
MWVESTIHEIGQGIYVLESFWHSVAICSCRHAMTVESTLDADTNNKHKPIMLLRRRTRTQTELLSQTRRVASQKQQCECVEGERERCRDWTPAKKESWSYCKRVSLIILNCQSSVCLWSRSVISWWLYIYSQNSSQIVNIILNLCSLFVGRLGSWLQRIGV